MWAYAVALPPVQAEFGVVRADASLPYTLAMFGFAIGSVVTGRLSDRLGIMSTLAVGAVAAGLGFIGSGLAPSLMRSPSPTRCWASAPRPVSVR
jgi:MFS family permease